MSFFVMSQLCVEAKEVFKVTSWVFNLCVVQEVTHAELHCRFGG